MIDVHCHLLYGVDDGAKTLEESIEMLENAKTQGIDTIFVTPHLRQGMFPYRIDEVENNFRILRNKASEIGIKLYLGTEYHVNSQIVENFRNKRCHSLGDSKYVLTEYSHDTEFAYMKKMTRELLSNGYIPVVVHVERYGCLVEDIDNIYELKENGALIQNNADAVLGLEGRRTKKFCKKLLKEELTDIIASDCHGINNRVCNMDKCYEYVAKKHGSDYADELFIKNPGKIVKAVRQ